MCHFRENGNPGIALPKAGNRFSKTVFLLEFIQIKIGARMT